MNKWGLKARRDDRIYYLLVFALSIILVTGLVWVSRHPKLVDGVDTTRMDDEQAYTCLSAMLGHPAGFKGIWVTVSGTYSLNDGYHNVMLSPPDSILVHEDEDGGSHTHDSEEYTLSIEFEPSSDVELTNGDKVTVSGYFSTYMEGDTQYVTLRDAVVEY